MKQKVTMLKTQPGVHDGETYPVLFEEGEEYEIGSELLRAFTEMGIIEAGEDDGESQDDSEDKAIDGAPDNKMIKDAPENKSRGRKKA